MIIVRNRSQSLVEQSKDHRMLSTHSSNLNSCSGSSTEHNYIPSLLVLLPAHYVAAFLSGRRASLTEQTGAFPIAYVTELQDAFYHYFFPPTDPFYFSLFIFWTITISSIMKIFIKISSGTGCLEKKPHFCVSSENLRVHKSFLELVNLLRLDQTAYFIERLFYSLRMKKRNQRMPS